MSTDERDESLSRPTKGTPGVRRENTEMDGERRSFNRSNYGNNGRGNYGNNRGGYDNRSNYGNAGGQGGQYNRPYRSNSNNYYEPQRPVRQNPNMGQENEGAPTEGAVRKRRPRVGDTRVNYNNYGNDQRQPMGGRQGGGNRYGNQGASRQ